MFSITFFQNTIILFSIFSLLNGVAINVEICIVFITASDDKNDGTYSAAFTFILCSCSLIASNVVVCFVGFI